MYHNYLTLVVWLLPLQEMSAQTGFVIPLSLASLSPETLNGERHSYSLLLQQSTAIANLPPSAPERDVVSTDMYNDLFPCLAASQES